MSQELLLYLLKLRDLSSSASVILEPPNDSLPLQIPSCSPSLAQQVGGWGLAQLFI